MSLVELIEYIVSLIFSFITFFTFGAFLWYRSKKFISITVSYSMYLYMSCCTIQSFFAIWHLIYMIAFWRQDTMAYNGYILYSTGAPAVFLQMINAFALNYLGLDRIISILFPLNFTLRRRLWLTYLYILFLLVLTGKCCFDFIIPDFPKSPATICYSYGCMTVSKAQDWYLAARFGIAAFNIFVAASLAALFKKHFPNLKSNTKTNKVIFVTAIAAILFDFIPHLASFLLMKIWRISTENIGPYSLVLGSMDSGICAILYFKIFSNKVKTTRLIVILSRVEATPT